jgi:hypothetical protein
MRVQRRAFAAARSGLSIALQLRPTVRLRNVLVTKLGSVEASAGRPDRRSRAFNPLIVIGSNLPILTLKPCKNGSRAAGTRDE